LRKIRSGGKQRKKPQNRKKKELRDFMARRIAQLIEEQEDKSKQLRARDLAVKVERTGRLEKPIYTGEKNTYPRSSKLRGITLEPFERPSALISYYVKRR
jgi:hypothetical protein